MKIDDFKGVYQSLFAPISLIGMIHVIGGVAIIVSHRAAKVSALSGLTMIFDSSPWVGVLLISVGVLAMWARVLPLSESVRLLCVAPQQVVLLVQALGILMAIWNGVYPDGYMPAPTLDESRWFILGDQAPVLVLCLSHFFDMMFARRILLTQLQFEQHINEEARHIETLETELELERQRRQIEAMRRKK